MEKKTNTNKRNIKMNAVLVGIAGSHNAFSLSLYNLKAYAYQNFGIRKNWNISVIQHPLINFGEEYDKNKLNNLLNKIISKKPLELKIAWDNLRPSKLPQKQTVLKAQEIYKKNSGSIYTIASGEAMGSAVAVSNTILLTNCHILTDELIEIYHEDKKKYIFASFYAGDFETDRCLVKVGGKKLNKIYGYREFEDLEVGEDVYAIGNPLGFFTKTLSSGLISSLRGDSKLNIIQTNAAISEGSSGGGLFDAYGNLIGITTAYAKEGQNINLAIAASDFWKKN